MKNIELIRSKIIKKNELERLLNIWRFQGKKLVFTNGCFDILHLGHIDYLSKAKDQGDVLIIGLNTDASVKRIKGSNRPVNDEQARSMILASLRFVDVVVFFDEDTPYDLISFVKPDILVKGSDYKVEEIVGYDIVKNNGGQIITLDLAAGYSTTGILEKIKNNPD
ncbi:MAG: D-glycero-beta-D-manno-heptose 1-phosphate adenylyltransferase [Bacteroidales bacterium]|nr:D-glycero-beta-D-manno-heptose 1-phosphate adenylyltransferase [Bacteroidales bacterium]MCF8388021.1 D-glycero-beta-D-manno-heptose 1-phosphate adenylyltransferase [Bacteroidales bacterium]MCF8398294.1 D-glycero-beta-D-manno-heptose 1-phosphate adenylyltransferase [Bacteroidales bacterium]